MQTKVDIGIIGAMDSEISLILSELSEHRSETVGSVEFHLGELRGKRVAIAKCGIGKVFAAICAQTMILTYSPELIINTGVGGGLKHGIAVTDIVVATELLQHDMDTSAIGDPVGLVSGINRIYFESDARARAIVLREAERLGIRCHEGRIASGDKFIADRADKERIISSFDASVCEMEGAAIAQTSFVCGTKFCVIRAISDSADEGSSMDYMKFLPIAAETSSRLTLALVEAYR